MMLLMYPALLKNCISAQLAQLPVPLLTVKRTVLTLSMPVSPKSTEVGLALPLKL